MRPNITFECIAANTFSSTGDFNQNECSEHSKCCTCYLSWEKNQCSRTDKAAANSDISLTNLLWEKLHNFSIYYEQEHNLTTKSQLQKRIGFL